MSGQRFLFPRWTNRVPAIALVSIAGVATAVVAGASYYGSNKHLEVGYQPSQPVEYSHKLHAGELGIDCRYCHTTVETSAFAAVPPTQTCMNCHAKVRTDSLKLLPVRESWANDKPIEWTRVHKLPDYAYFNHSAHVTVGVGCASCHGRVDQMAKVEQVQPLNMGWCLDCHRDPGPSLRDPSEVTKMDWKASPERLAALETAKAKGEPVRAKNGRPVTPPLHCSGCHR